MANTNALLSLNSQGDQVKAAQANLAKVGAAISTTETLLAVRHRDGGCRQTIPDCFQAARDWRGRRSDASDVEQCGYGCGHESILGERPNRNGLQAAGQRCDGAALSIAYGGTATKLAEAKTDANGVYSLPYAAPAKGSNLEIRVVDAQGAETTISSTTYNASAHTVLNLVAPASVQPLTAEYQRLSADVQSAIGGTGIQNLASAQESATQQDLTLLNTSTGWDARLLSIGRHRRQAGNDDGYRIRRVVCAFSHRPA